MDMVTMKEFKQQITTMLNGQDTEVLEVLFQCEFGVGAEVSETPDDNVEQFRFDLHKANIKIAYVDDYGGEGMGDDFWSVYSFNNDYHIVYVKFNGWYASYNGAEYTDWYFVEPKEKVITVFERVVETGKKV